SSSLPPSLLAASVIFAGGGGAAKSRSSDASEGSFTAAEVQMSTERLRHKLRVLLAVALPIAFFAAGVSSVAAEEQRVRVGMIPDAGATQVAIDEKAPLRDYLKMAIGAPVELIIPTSYNATVEALGNGSLDFAYLGGLTYVKARARYQVVPLVQ